MDNLVCSACEGTDKQRLRGCTSPPRVPHTDLDDRDLGWVDFTHDHFHAECDLRATAPTSTAAVRFWPFADLGGSIQVLGRVWERCPRSYMQAPFFGTMPPESTSAVFHIRAVASGASQKITLKFAGQERDIPITNGGGQLWYSETFGGLDFPPGELVYGEISSTPHIDIDSFCGWFEPAA